MATSEGPGLLPEIDISRSPRMVQLPEDKLFILMQKLRSQDSRLVACRNLHLLLYETQKELEEKEKHIKQYEAAYNLAQCQIQKLARSQTNLPSVEVLDTSFESESRVSSVPVQIHQSADSADLEMDCPFAEHRPVTISVSSGSQNTTCSSPVKITYGKEPKFTERLKSVELGKNLGVLVEETTGSKQEEKQLRSRGMTENEEDTVHNNDDIGNTTKTGTVRINSTVCSRQTSTIDPYVDMAMSLPAMPYITGVSKTVFDNVVKENVKLKKMLQDLFDKVNNDNQDKEKGIQDLLDVQEYRDVVRQLRVVIAERQQKIKELQADILAHEQGDVEALTATNLKLREKVDHAMKQLQNKQELLDSYIQAYEKLKRDTSTNQGEDDMTTSLPLISGLPSGIPATVHAFAKERKGSSESDVLESFKEENKKLKKEINELQEKEFAYKEQLKEFQDSFKEWELKEKKYQKMIAERNVQLDKMVQEVQKCSSQLSVMPRMSPKLMATGGRDCLPRFGSPFIRPSVVVSDSPHDESGEFHSPPATQRHRAVGRGTSPHNAPDLHVCPRCEKEYEDKDAYQTHIKRCMDM